MWYDDIYKYEKLYKLLKPKHERILNIHKNKYWLYRINIDPFFLWKEFDNSFFWYLQSINIIDSYGLTNSFNFSIIIYLDKLFFLIEYQKNINMWWIFNIWDFEITYIDEIIDKIDKIWFDKVYKYLKINREYKIKEINFFVYYIFYLWNKEIIEMLENYINKYSNNVENNKTNVNILIENVLYNAKYYEDWTFIIWNYQNKINKLSTIDKNWISFFFTILKKWLNQNLINYKWDFEENKKIFYYQKNKNISNTTFKTDHPNRFNKFSEKNNLWLKIINDSYSWISIQKVSE